MKAYQKLWDVANTVLWGKFIALSILIKKKCIKYSYLKNSDLSFKKQGKWEQFKAKVNRRKEIMQARTELSEIINRKTIENTHESKSWSFEKHQ